MIRVTVLGMTWHQIAGAALLCLGFIISCDASVSGCRHEDGSHCDSSSDNSRADNSQIRKDGAIAIDAPSDVFPAVKIESLGGDLDHPWDLGWLPSGMMLISERSGHLRILSGTDTVVISPDDIVAEGEGGLLGLEVDPNFSKTGYVFVCAASQRATPPDIRLIRFRFARDGRSVLARKDIVIGIPYRSGGRHSGCRPRFGPDDHLWVGTGDAATGTHPQDDRSLGGKVLRVDREGNAASGNPGNLRWYSKGHRNVQGIAFRADGFGVSVEHGPSVDDEVNALSQGNFGWDPRPGYNERVPMTDLVKFPEAVEALWSSGSPTLAPSGAGFLSGNQWGAWDNALVVAMLKASHLRIFRLDKSGHVLDDRTFIEGYGRLRSARQGPDGNLYVTTDGTGQGGKILKVIPVVN